MCEREWDRVCVKEWECERDFVCVFMREIERNWVCVGVWGVSEELVSERERERESKKFNLLKNASEPFSQFCNKLENDGRRIKLNCNTFYNLNFEDKLTIMMSKRLWTLWLLSWRQISGSFQHFFLVLLYSWGQFHHQHFMSNFSAQKFFEQLFSIYSLAL